MGYFEENRTYKNFAGVYDNFMDDIPYAAWFMFVRNLLELHNVHPDGWTVIAELGCGTGTMTEIFLKAGYGVIASDLSAEMINVAKQKCRAYITGDDRAKKPCDEGFGAEFFQADMRSFKLKDKVPAIISLCDSVNYLIEDGDLETLFRTVKSNLCDGGVFIFDLKTLWLYENAMADNVFAESRSNCAYIWENYFDSDTKINEYALTLFLENEQGSYDRCEEIHLQRAYEPDEIRRAAHAAGMELEAIYGQEPFEELLEEDERMFVVLRKPERNKLNG